jgi:hypothetical protein
MQKYTHPGKKIPLHRGHVARLAHDLNIHRNTLVKKWSRNDPRIIYAVALRQSELSYPIDKQYFHQFKEFLVGNYLRQVEYEAKAGEVE